MDFDSFPAYKRENFERLMPVYLCDFHTHTRVSFDSEAALSEMMEAARRAGLQELCITDHCDLLDGDGAPTLTFPWPEALEQYRQRGASPVTVRLGLELGSAPYDPQAARAVLAQAGEELDFVLGSLHNWIGAQDNRDFYLNILQFQGQNSFPHCLLEFLQNLCCHMLSCDNLPALPPHQLRLLSRFFAYGITGVIMDWTKSGMSLDPEPGVDLLEKLLSNHMIHQALLGQLEPREGTEEGDVSFVHIV